jgi:hypothetical protein
LSEKRWVLPLWIDTRIRHYHKTDKGKVIEFSVQLEIFVEGHWKEVIRYDTAHGVAHIDRFNIRGQQQKKFLSLTYEEALTRAEREIKKNWQIYRERFLQGEFP